MIMSERNSRDAKSVTKHLTCGAAASTSCGQTELKSDQDRNGMPGRNQRFAPISKRAAKTNLLKLETERTNDYSKGELRFGLTSSFLVNYLRWASLCSCCDMLSIYTLLMFVLLLSSFIEAHQERGHANRAAHPIGIDAVRLAGGQSNWTLARVPAERRAGGLARPRESTDGGRAELQQRTSSGADLVEAVSEQTPSEAPEYYEILRLDKPTANKSQATPRQAKDSRHSNERLAGAYKQQHNYQGSQRQAGLEQMTKTTPIKRPQAANQRRPPSGARPATEGSKRLEPQASHWIPVTGNPLASSQAAAALLDYPPERHQPVYGQRRPSPARWPHQLDDENYLRHQSQWRHRRPRFHNEPQDNEIGPPPQAAGKLYKRVLLCDKTLVSLDYIRSGSLLPPDTPFGGSIDTNRLDEHEINEISDSFLDLENQMEGSMLRPSLSRANRTSELKPAPSPQWPNPLQTGATTALNASSRPERLSVESSNLIQVERRSDPDFWPPLPLPPPPPPFGATQLLSDEDPLVRCDMWDLEKGLKSRKPPRELLRMAVKADFDTVRDAINRCRQLSQRTLPPEDETGRDGLEMIMSADDLVSLFSMKRGLMPGTKWCGLGDQASQYNDLGPKHRIDICCRAHDHCPIRSKPFRNDYGILNIGLYTKSHCDCDADFYRCLREVRSRTADMLGNLYFNVMKLQCMREERLQVCREAKPIALGFERCIRYEDQSPIKTVFKFTTPPVAY